MNGVGKLDTVLSAIVVGKRTSSDMTSSDIMNECDIIENS